MRLYYKPSRLKIRTGAVMTIGNIRSYSAIIPWWVTMNHLAVSGGYGQGTIDHGEYECLHFNYHFDASKAYLYTGDGIPWYLYLKPLFKTSRTELLIHPENHIPGTAGCIAIQHKDMRFHDRIKKAFERNESVVLTVL